MNILTSLVLFGFQQEALAGTPYYNPIAVMNNFQEWKHSDKMGTIGSVDLADETVDLPLYNVDVSPLLYTYGGASAEKQEQIIALMPETSLIVVTEDFAKDNELEIQTTNKRLIPVPDDFKTGGEIKYVEIPELHVGKLVIKDVIAFVSGSEKKWFRFNWFFELLGNGNRSCGSSCFLCCFWNLKAWFALLLKKMERGF